MLQPGLHALWPTPVGIFQLADAGRFNVAMLKLAATLRQQQCARRGVAPDAAFFASDDDLAPHLRTFPEGLRFLKFIADGLQQVVGHANLQAWSGRMVEPSMQLEGMWFQCSRDGAFHDVHTHANCSWSAAYVVQIDPDEDRIRHPVYGMRNGVTRFYGPPFQQLAGASVDLGNAYLLPPHVDVAPLAGQLIVFPAWLPHKAMPYGGNADRVVISFNASIRNKAGDNVLPSYGA